MIRHCRRKVSEPQVLVIETIQNETKIKNFNEKSSCDLWDNFKQSYKHWNVGIPKREVRERMGEKYLKKYYLKFFSNLIFKKL